MGKLSKKMQNWKTDDTTRLNTAHLDHQNKTIHQFWLMKSISYLQNEVYDMIFFLEITVTWLIQVKREECLINVIIHILYSLFHFLFSSYFLFLSLCFSPIFSYLF